MARLPLVNLKRNGTLSPVKTCSALGEMISTLAPSAGFSNWLLAAELDDAFARAF